MRIENWDIALRQFLQSNRRTKFSWGQWDCVLFSAKCADAITGSNHAHWHSGMYDSKESAYEYLAGIGLTMDDVFDLHYTRKPLRCIQSGDVALITPITTGEKTYAVFDGSSYVCASKSGLITFSPKAIERHTAWRIE